MVGWVVPKLDAGDRDAELREVEFYCPAVVREVVATLLPYSCCRKPIGVAVDAVCDCVLLLMCAFLFLMCGETTTRRQQWSKAVARETKSRITRSKGINNEKCSDSGD
ncbi:hypothetical protein L6452_21841 [Arctium lappa]|uniref:Uncharacterized protein n=1 Tax=Arctium lappa TaxID=4217 RepID=A0ACB9B2H3_ARCLA|nr:hypothetical protein L6452_21841 [Arctium lappa]